jgi:hypothetical protein
MDNAMSLIDQRVAAARRRLWINRYLQYQGTCLLWGGLTWLLAIVVRKMLIHTLRLDYAAAVVLCLSVVAALIWLLRRAEDPITAAVALDQAGSAKERLSTALYLRQSTDPFSKAAVADAERTAATLQVRRLLPVRYPRQANAALAGWGAALLLVLFLPTLDLTGRAQATQKQKEDLKKQQEIVAKQVEKVQKVREEIRKAAKPDAEMDKKLTEFEQKMASLSTQPDKMGVQAVKQMTSLQEEVRKQQQALQQQAEAMQVSLSKLALANLDSKSQVSQFSKALASGDFKESRNALQQMQKQIQDAAKDPAKAAELAKQLDELARQLKDQSLSQDLAKQLKAAGLTKEQMDKLAKAAKDGKPLTEAQKQDLQQAMKNQGLSDAQVQQMMQKLDNALKASQMANKLGQSMADAARDLKQQAQGKNASGQQGQPGQGDQDSKSTDNSPGQGKGQGKGSMADAGEQLGEMEAMQTELESMQAMLADLQGKPGQASAEPGQDGGNGGSDTDSKQVGNGMGKGGVGGLRTAEHTPTALTRSKADTKWRNGRIVGEYFDDSQQVKGESRSELVDVISSAQRDAAKTIDEHKLPPQYDGPVGEYFRQLRQVSQAGGAKPAGK